MSFTLDIKEYADKTGKDIVDIVQQTCAEVFTKIIIDTPVGNPELWKGSPPADYKPGALKANWQTSLNQKAMGRLDKKDKTGKRTVNRMLAMVKAYNGEGSVWMANNLSYANRIEYLGHSSQAPSGMVRVNLLAFRQAMEKAIKQVDK